MTCDTVTKPPALVGQVQRPVGPPRRIRVSFACNDERNGMFAGRAWMAQPESLYRVGRHPWDAELVHDDWGRGVVLTYGIGQGRVASGYRIILTCPPGAARS